MNGEKKIIRVLRELPAKWDWFIKIAESIHYGRIEKIEFREKQPRFVRLVYDLNFENEEDLKKKLEELKTIALIE
jgi:hypothetical protein